MSVFRQIAALYVQADGCYVGLRGVDPWPLERDARLYDGPYPVIAHPPCERWGRHWGGSPTTWPRKIKGDDQGCFAAALMSVRRFGGVLEHPAHSAAWATFGISTPPFTGGWIWADEFGGWTCHVEQGAYGHRARKATWLYACRSDLPALSWGRTQGDFARLDDGFHSAQERRRAVRSGTLQRLSHRQRAATPLPFRDLLIGIARSVHQIAAPCGSEARGVVPRERVSSSQNLLLGRQPQQLFCEIVRCSSVLSTTCLLNTAESGRGAERDHAQSGQALGHV